MRLLPALAALVFSLSVLPATAAATPVARLPVVPPLRGAVGDHARAIAAHGLALGNDDHVFAKVGDSITESGSFLQDLACQPADWGGWRGLRSARHWFGEHTLPRSYASVWCGRANSFSRASVTAVAGWDASMALGRLAGPPQGCDGALAHPLDCEYHLLHPGAALVMYGTNDLERFSPRRFGRNLGRLVARSSAAGVIPVLSTIPPRLDSRRYGRRVAVFNRAIAAVAREKRVPLWNYWRSLQGSTMVNHGISDDGIHPNIYGDCRPPLGCRSLDFTAAGLRFGYDQRNLGALRVLDRLRQRIFRAGSR
jgi:hypothetical protein